MTRLQVHGLTSRTGSIIEEMIAGGELKMGDRINEVTLANTLGVSRGPIREACRALAERGLLVVVPNRGAFVRTISLEQAKQLYEARAGVSGYAGYLLAIRPQPNLLKQLDELVQAMDEATASGRVENYYLINLEFHRTIFEATENEELNRIYQNLVTQLHLFRAQSLVPASSQRQSNQEHREIIEGVASGQPMVAFAAMHGHVEAGMRRFFFNQTRGRNEQSDDLSKSA